MLNDSSKSDKQLHPKEARVTDHDPMVLPAPRTMGAQNECQSFRRPWLSHVLISATPLLLATAIAIIYWLTSSVFIQCNWGLAGCQKLTVASAYLANHHLLHKYPTDKSQPVSEIELQLQNKIREKTEVNEAVGKVILQSDSLAKQLAEPSKLSAEENTRLTTTKKNLDALALALAPRQTNLHEHIKALQGQLSSIHNRQSRIYWSRVMYATFVALFVMASLASVTIAAFIINRISSKYAAVRFAALTITALLSVAVGVWLYLNRAEHFMVINEITTHIAAVDAKNIEKVTNILNSFGYAATTALVLAVTALLWFPAKIVVAPNTAHFARDVEILATRMKYLRIILYVGTAMLLIAIFRMKTGMDWSLASLVQDEVSAAETFNKTLITSQGSFFTLLLAAVYIPAAYIILKAADCMTPADDDEKNKTLNSKGLTMTAPSFKEYLPRLTVMLLPFLVGPIGELARYVFN